MAEQRRTGTFDNKFKFNGKELDSETGLYYYGARYYNPRTSVWLSVDPMAEKYPSYSPYNYALQNPIRYTDPDGKAPTDIIVLNKNGGIFAVIPDGKAHITIVDHNYPDKVLSLSSYYTESGPIHWNNRSRQVVANIAGYYGKQVGLSGIGATSVKEGIAHYDPLDKGIWVSPLGNGRISPYLNNKYNLQSTLVHENFHKKDHAMDIKSTFTSHANVYIKQMSDPTFNDTSLDYQEFIISNFLGYVNAARLEKGIAHARELIDEFNNTNVSGWKADYGFKSGYGWPVEHNGEEDYLNPPTIEKSN